jgi:DNA-binding MarR family transcriptional regulator
MGLATKSSTEGYFFDDLGSTPLFERFMLHLANAFTQLATTRLTEKQRLLLFASNQTLRYYPNLSPTALAERLSRKLGLPLSTTKFNLKVLKEAGLLETKPASKRRTSTSLSFGGHLLAQLLSKPELE